MIERLGVAVLRAACPERSEAQLAPWVDPIKRACEKFEIDRPRRIAAFVAALAHECGFVPGREENLNYSAKRLSQVWPKRFAQGKPGIPNATALQIAGKPQAIANVVYAGRMGNGDAASGDGWTFRGVGPLQLTGRANHQAFAAAIGKTLAQEQDYIRTLEGGVMSAAWYWEENDINRLADTPGVEDETRAINGGAIGIDDRRKRFEAALGALVGQGG